MTPGTASVPETEPTDYTGAVYGSLLAASVIVGATPAKDPPRPLELIALLLATGFVFWVAHVYAGLAGDRRRGTTLDAERLRVVAREEWPLAQAAFPPAIAAATFWALGFGDAQAAWAALLVALTAQVCWAVVADLRSDAAFTAVALSAAVNLLLGMVVVLLKTALAH